MNDASLSEAQLTWLRFRRHRLAMIGLAIVIGLYVIAIFAEAVAPFSPDKSNARLVFHPPQAIHWIDQDQDGWHIRPFVYGYRLARDPVTLAATYVLDGTRKTALTLFAHGDPYRLFAIIPTNVHLFGPVDPAQPMFLVGADRQGRDVLSRIIIGARASLSIGLLGGLVHPAGDRVHHFAADHSDLARFGGSPAQGHVTAGEIFLHHRHHFADRLD
jgi:peptide/nickel transport system permease protein